MPEKPRKKLSEKFLREAIPKLERAIKGLKNSPPRVREPHEKQLQSFKIALAAIEKNKEKQKKTLPKRQQEGKLPKKKKKKDRVKSNYFQAVGEIAATISLEATPTQGSYLSVRPCGINKKFPLWATIVHKNHYLNLQQQLATSNPQNFLLTVYPEFLGQETCQGFSLVYFKEIPEEEGFSSLNHFELRGEVKGNTNCLIIKRNPKARKKLGRLVKKNVTTLEAIASTTHEKKIYLDKNLPGEEGKLYFADFEAALNQEGQFEIVQQKKIEALETPLKKLKPELISLG